MIDCRGGGRARRGAGRERQDRQIREEGWSPYAIGLWGDLPYSPLQAETGVPNLIADMNAQRLAFSVHDGDLNQGSGSNCDEAMYQQALDYLDVQNESLRLGV